MDVANPVADSVPADDAFLIVIFISNKVISELFFLSMSILLGIFLSTYVKSILNEEYM